jgi:hypothetical protein
MIEKRFGEKWSSSRGMYIRSTSNIPLKWENMRNIADIPMLYAIQKPAFQVRLSETSENFREIK